MCVCTCTYGGALLKPRGSGAMVTVTGLEQALATYIGLGLRVAPSFAQHTAAWRWCPSLQGQVTGCTGVQGGVQGNRGIVMAQRRRVHSAQRRQSMSSARASVRRCKNVGHRVTGLKQALVTTAGSTLWPPAHAKAGWQEPLRTTSRTSLAAVAARALCGAHWRE